MAVQKFPKRIALPQTCPEAVQHPGMGWRFFPLFKRKKISALQVVNAKVRFGRIGARIVCSLTSLTVLGQEKASLAPLKLSVKGMPSGALCLTLILLDWVGA